MGYNPESAQVNKFEKFEEKRENSAEELLKKIMDDFSHSEFTFDDIHESYNDLINSGRNELDFHKYDLDELVRIGALLYNEESKTYEVDHSSDHVVSLVE